MLNYWNRIPVVIRGVVVGLLVVLSGIALWNVDFALVPLPWSLLIMILILWAYLNYFSGIWFKNNNTEFRRTNFRKTRLSAQQWK